jgi:hypothetical protein
MGSTVARVVRKTLTQQMVALARMPITSNVTVKGSRLRWRGLLQPSPLSRTYTLELTYAGANDKPVVKVLEPALRREGVERLPHVFPGDRLCLCYPWEWNASHLIAWTIIPWAAEWLLQFEIFEVTGRWHGGGHEPD